MDRDRIAFYGTGATMAPPLCGTWMYLHSGGVKGNSIPSLVTKNYIPPPRKLLIFSNQYADTKIMRISNGLSEINIPKLNNNRVQNEKIYLWPLYDPGKIQNIQEVRRHHDLGILYSKPSGEERDSIIQHYLKNPDQEYTASGSINQKYPNLPPGSLFNALV